MRVALVGNQNSGKTSLFNCLTGSNQKVGNWPGVTIDRKEGIIKGTDTVLVDLPGIYSLSPYTAEEEVSRKYVLEENPDIIINIVDATSLERSLYLTTQLLELDCKVVLALNMCDMLEKKGISIDEKLLGEKLHMDVVKISALKNTGIQDLIDLLTSGKVLENPHQKIYEENVEKAIQTIFLNLTEPMHRRFIAVKLLEQDMLFKELLDDSVLNVIRECEKIYGLDMEQVIANQRYLYIDKIKQGCLIKREVPESMTDKLDKIFLNKWLALPIFAMIMSLVYFLAVGVVGSYTVDLISGDHGIITVFQNWLADFLISSKVSPWLISLICDGIIAGVSAVLGFVPQLIILFLCICLLETSGYMSRIAFLLDKLFRSIGLSGKSLIPFIVGSGCSVPGIMTCRTIEDETERRITIMLTPFMPCSAKLPILTLFAGSFFSSYAWIATVILYLLAILIIVLSSMVMKKWIFPNKGSAFISELPEYKLPSVQYVLRDVSEKTFAFIQRAGTIILSCSVVVWFMLSFSWKLEYGVSIEYSILAGIGKGLAWLFYPMLGTLSWGSAVSALQGLIAKEQVVSSMAIIAGLFEETADSAIFAGNGIFSFFTPASAYAFMVFNLFSAPCFGAIGAMRRELGSTKRMLQAVFFQTGIAWVLAVLIYQMGHFLEVMG